MWMVVADVTVVVCWPFRRKIFVSSTENFLLFFSHLISPHPPSSMYSDCAVFLFSVKKYIYSTPSFLHTFHYLFIYLFLYLYFFSLLLTNVCVCIFLLQRRALDPVLKQSQEKVLVRRTQATPLVANTSSKHWSRTDKLKEILFYRGFRWYFALCE